MAGKRTEEVCSFKSGASAWLRHSEGDRAAGRLTRKNRPISGSRMARCESHSLKGRSLAVDYAYLTERLGRFYDFTGKIVIYVGAGGRQLLDCSGTKAVIAIDQDAAALSQLKARTAQGAQPSMEIISSRFEEATAQGDVVYFDFCLHEMNDPARALAHAATLAKDVVVFDHAAGSDWSFHAAEEHEVQRSADSIERFGIRRRERFTLEQRFANHAELLAKISVQGETAIQRAQRFAADQNIEIPMSCELVLL